MGEISFGESCGQCPLCGAGNHCRMAGTETAPETCWCREEHFPESLLKKVPPALQNRACICRHCVVKARREEALNRPLPEAGVGDFYLERDRFVFTAQYHRRRGYCCGSNCRHCPFEGLERELAYDGDLPE